MYLLSASIYSSGNEFTSKCYSNLIKVERKLSNSTIQANTPNYILKFRATNSSVFSTDGENNIKAAIYNCMANYNISVWNLELIHSQVSGSRRRRQTSDKAIVFKFYSTDSNSELLQLLLNKNLTISDYLILMSALVNGHSYCDGSSSSSVR